MPAKLERVVPWGRSFDEYVRMFDLGPGDLAGKVLDCGGGPASFNAALTRRGGDVVSCDPLYAFTVEEIAGRIAETYPAVLASVRANRDAYVWEAIAGPDELGRTRLAAMHEFLADFPVGRGEGRYRVDELPSLSFATGRFDLALCSHLLFTYSDAFPLAFHVAAIAELCRVAAEVRVFPLLDQAGQPSPWLDPAVSALADMGYRAEVRHVAYEFQRGGNRCLRVRRGGRSG